MLCACSFHLNCDWSLSLWFFFPAAWLCTDPWGIEDILLAGEDEQELQWSVDHGVTCAELLDFCQVTCSFFFFTFSQSNARLHGISSSFSTSRITLSHTHINERTTQSSVDFVGWTRTRTAYSLKGVKLIVAQPKRKGSSGISSFFLPDVLIYWIVRKAWMNQKSRWMTHC